MRLKYCFKKTKAIFTITLGKEGTLLGYKGETITIPSIPVKPVDTTGAGDAFIGAVLYQLSDFSFEKFNHTLSTMATHSFEC
jgi:fructokinase